jgi:hypothetical protein
MLEALWLMMIIIRCLHRDCSLQISTKEAALYISMGWWLPGTALNEAAALEIIYYDAEEELLGSGALSGSFLWIIIKHSSHSNLFFDYFSQVKNRAQWRPSGRVASKETNSA